MHKHNNGEPTKWIIVSCPCCSGNKKVINGQLLKYAREQANLSQREFGWIVNLSSPYISDIERNRRDCPEDIFKAYMKLRKRA